MKEFKEIKEEAEKRALVFFRAGNRRIEQLNLEKYPQMPCSHIFKKVKKCSTGENGLIPLQNPIEEQEVYRMAAIKLGKSTDTVQKIGFDAWDKALSGSNSCKNETH